MRISDWSSDVCSSDLELVSASGQRFVERSDPRDVVADGGAAPHRQLAADEVHGLDAVGALVDRRDAGVAEVLGDAGLLDVAHAAEQIGRASCRGRVCQYV